MELYTLEIDNLLIELELLAADRPPRALSHLAAFNTALVQLQLYRRHFNASQLFRFGALLVACNYDILAR